MVVSVEQHQPQQQSSILQKDAHGLVSQSDSSLFCSSVAPARLHSMYSRGNPAPATQVFQGGNVGPGQCGGPSEIVGEHRGAHE